MNFVRATGIDGQVVYVNLDHIWLMLPKAEGHTSLIAAAGVRLRRPAVGPDGTPVTGEGGKAVMDEIIDHPFAQVKETPEQLLNSLSER